MNLSPITDVFSEIIEWMATAMQSVLAIFYTTGTSGAAGSLTFLGMLAVAGLAIAVFMLLLNVIKSFIRFQ